MAYQYWSYETLYRFCMEAAPQVDTAMEDHIADEWRYLCMARPIQPLMPAEPSQLLSDPLRS